LALPQVGAFRAAMSICRPRGKSAAGLPDAPDQGRMRRNARRPGRAGSRRKDLASQSDDTLRPNVPYRTNVKAEQRYRWCSCGRSATQPFCDESHRDTTFLPVLFKLPQDLTVALCGCKQTKRPPFCDGSHVHVGQGEDR